MLAGLPPELQIHPLADQSLFVRASIDGVVKEATIAACLTGLMILLFLGNWRSTVIIAVSIPLSILTSIIVLSALGETINIMTLGGLALAVGILVDDATVEIENINRNLAMGKEVEHAILDGAQQIAVPAFVSTLAICIVFVPMFFLGGVARYLFVPLAEAVVFAMLASYLLSRTLVPTMAKYLLRGHEPEGEHPPDRSRNPLVRMQVRFEEGFERFRERYHGWLERCLQHRAHFSDGFSRGLHGFCRLPSSVAGPGFLSRRSMPASSSCTCGRAPEPASRRRRGFAIWWSNPFGRDSARRYGQLIDNIGLPYSGINLSYSNSAPIGSADADILVSLNPATGPRQNTFTICACDCRRSFPA